MEISSSVIKSNSLLRKEAREKLKGNWGMVIILCFIAQIISTVPTLLNDYGFIISLAILGPLSLGLSACFLKLARKESFSLENLFDGFNRFLSSFLTYILTVLFSALWTLLLIIPGIIAIYRYSMAYYILNDQPEISAMEAIKASKMMMKGYKWKLFTLHLSFLGWGILCIFTLGLGFLWLIPYMNASAAHFYQNLKEVQADTL